MCRARHRAGDVDSPMNQPSVRLCPARLAALKRVESGGSPSRDGSPQGTAVPAVLGAGRVGREVSRQPE